MNYPYEPRLAMTKKWGLSWEEVLWVGWTRKGTLSSTYVIEYSMETKAKHRVDVVRMVA